MSNSERLLLSNGLKFVPSPQVHDKVQYGTDIGKFCDKLRKFEFFNSSTLDENEDSITPVRDLFSNRSRWQPPESKDKVLHSVINNIKSQTEQPVKNKLFKNNLPFNQRTALVSLQKNNNIVIKGAEKGGATTIINKSDYHSNMLNI